MPLLPPAALACWCQAAPAPLGRRLASLPPRLLDLQPPAAAPCPRPRDRGRAAAARVSSCAAGRRGLYRFWCAASHGRHVECWFHMSANRMQCNMCHDCLPESCHVVHRYTTGAPRELGARRQALCVSLPVGARQGRLIFLCLAGGCASIGGSLEPTVAPCRFGLQRAFCPEIPRCPPAAKSARACRCVRPKRPGAI